jgi:hypothetical protein
MVLYLLIYSLCPDSFFYSTPNFSNILLGASLEGLTNRQYKTLLVVAKISRQQLWLYENKKQSIDDRIVSLSQPHIRPIVRGKAGKSVEFGAKLSASYFRG